MNVERRADCAVCGTLGQPFLADLVDRNYGIPGSWSFVKCPICGLIWLTPRPSLVDVARVYVRSYGTHTANRDSGLEAVRRRLLRAVAAAALQYPVRSGSRADAVARFLQWVPIIRDMAMGELLWLPPHRTGRLLDVGAGNGQYAAAMRDLGWEVVGVEPDQEAARVAAEHYRVPVLVGTLETVALPADAFDAVTLSHVIEHVHDPKVFLHRCLQVLKPGGKLVMVTPNVASLGHRIFKKAWFGLDPPRHLYLFKHETLHRLATQVGFADVAVRSSARLAWWAWGASKLGRHTDIFRGGGQHRGMLLSGFVFQVLEQCMLMWMPQAGEELILTASKPA